MVHRRIQKRQQDEREKVLAKVKRAANRQKKQEATQINNTDDIFEDINRIVLENNGEPITFIDIMNFGFL